MSSVGAIEFRNIEIQNGRKTGVRLPKALETRHASVYSEAMKARVQGEVLLDFDGSRGRHSGPVAVRRHCVRPRRRGRMAALSGGGSNPARRTENPGNAPDVCMTFTCVESYPGGSRGRGGMKSRGASTNAARAGSNAEHGHRPVRLLSWGCGPLRPVLYALEVGAPPAGAAHAHPHPRALASLARSSRATRRHRMRRRNRSDTCGADRTPAEEQARVVQAVPLVGAGTGTLKPLFNGQNLEGWTEDVDFDQKQAMCRRASSASARAPGCCSRRVTTTTSCAVRRATRQRWNARRVVVHALLVSGTIACYEVRLADSEGRTGHLVMATGRTRLCSHCRMGRL